MGGSSKTMDSIFGTHTNDANDAKYEEEQAAAKVVAYKAKQAALNAEYERMATANRADRASRPQSAADLAMMDRAAIPGIVAQQAKTEEDLPWYKEYIPASIRHGATALYQGAQTPTGRDVLAGAAGIGASLIGRNEVAQGAKDAISGYDQSLAQTQQATDASLAAIGGIADSPEQMAYRGQAMKGLSARADMGLTPEDQAALQSIQRQSANQFKAANATIGQDMSRRGMANSGLGLAQSMGAADQAQQAQALAGQNQAAQSFAAKQGALTNLAGQSNAALQGDYSRQMGKAQNLTNVNQFNAQQKAAALQNKGIAQQGIATAKGASTGQIGQAIGGLIAPKTTPTTGGDKI